MQPQNLDLAFNQICFRRESAANYSELKVLDLDLTVFLSLLLFYP